MQEQDDLTPANHEFERALKSVQPTGGRVDPVAAAFAAGRRSAERNVRVWKAAAVLALFAGMGGALVIPTGRSSTPTPGVRQPIITVRYERAPVSEQSIVALQNVVAERGLAGLPAVRTPTPQPVRAKDFY